jgi:hypothetical protein
MKNLDKLIENIYVCDDTRNINIDPFILDYKKWNIYGTLESCDFEDIAARIIDKSKEYNQWVSISYKLLTHDISIDIKNLHNYHNNQIKQQNGSFLLKKLSSLAEKFSFNNKKSEAVYFNDIEDHQNLPFSSLLFQLYMYQSCGKNFLEHRIRGMEKLGYLEILELDDQTIIKPNYKLALTIYNKQNP